MAKAKHTKQSKAVAVEHRRGRQWMLTLEGDDPEVELDFEVRYCLSLSIAQRFRNMMAGSRRVRQLLESHGHQTAPHIVKRS